MKSLKELEEIRKKTLNSINMRKENDNIRVVVGMATCGIAAGARPVLHGRDCKARAEQRFSISDRLHRGLPAGANSRSFLSGQGKGNLC